jgi:hypothetical protein
MNKNSVLFGSAVMTAFLLLLTSCSASPGNVAASMSATPAITQDFRVVSQGEFDKALASFEIEQDEFDGSMIISPRKPGSLLDYASNKGRTVFLFDIGFGKDEDDKEIGALFGGFYMSSSWLLFDSVNFVSSTGKLTIEVPRQYKANDFDSDGISETFAVPLATEVVKELDKVLAGRNLKFRVNGSGDNVGENYSATVKPKVIELLKKAVTISFGIEQGLQFPAGN